MLSTAEVAARAGVHRDTLLRWLRENKVAEPQRDRHGWRAFTESEAANIAAYAGNQSDTSPEELRSLPGLERLDWDFVGARTAYLTHGLHPYPAKFIPQIPNALIQELSSVGETVADIFCGSGTTLLEALQLKRNAVGVDANPLAVLISKAKTTALNLEEMTEVSRHRAACARLHEAITPDASDLFYNGLPFRSAGWRPDPEMCEFWFYPHVVEELAELSNMISALHGDALRTLCQVCLSAIIVSVSLQDSDTRYVRREKAIEPGDTVRRYVAQLDNALVAVGELGDILESRFSCSLFEGDILSSPSTEQFDLVVTSPPYPNAFSYHLYHRTRLLWLQHDQQAFKRVEIGSHRKYSSKGADRATEATFKSEFERIFVWLRARLKDRKFACFVIGNSTLDGRLIDNADLISDAGASVGFREVKRIQRTIAATRKAFNPKIGKIKTENVLILQKV
ncbi:hypothetical protein FJW08_20515 [Mesorhizobium sp. B3-2-1]|uniref:DNA methyltransferase n=1 Tax=Mesorhizobium sp. B3-2-1 TaxID=2589891 RepID=UPI001125D906|nr:DNA methyltransferase [Mesorhizobium sp. B3-2-1]TPI28462.1 hypothetical protein FJW08_20515 [Mesorhizobium sp. B3-2-1]